MEGLQIKRERSTSNSDLDFIKIKRSDTPHDILAARLKDEGIEEGEKANETEHGGTEYETKEECKGSEDKNAQQHRRRHISHGYHLVEGKMKHGIEDCIVAKCKKIDGEELRLYAIFDGQSGREVAEYLQNNLFENILNEPDFRTSPKTAVKRAYEATDNDNLENIVGSRGGSTAVTAILINREKLVVAKVGDSHAVLCRNGNAEQITVDHEPLKEREMDESKGGFVSQKPGNVPRVDGQLAMTRAFGDERLKEHITAEPDIVIKNMDEDTEFIILASDGLWQVMSNQDAVDCVRGLKDGQEAAEGLVKEALVRESKDHISCVVVMFH